ncbi:Cell division trigger factor [Lachnospiraceae bacterium TWA4]|nr:Cell division trigger factor [Lachnospiraceae bacterium TWA4]
MKKKLTAIALAACLAMTVIGCSNNGNTDNKTATQASGEKSSEASTELTMGEFKGSDYVTKLDYKNLTVAKSAVEVTDDQVKSQVQSALLDANLVEVKDRAIKSGDTANIDYVGKIDGKEFEGGSDKGYDLVIGSGSFIPGFEDGLIGKESGKTVDVKVTFPDPYSGNADLSGKDAVFTVTINSIKVQPEYTDELVASKTDYKTIKEYEQSIKDSLYNSKLQSAISSALIDACTVSGYPESLTAYYKQSVINYYTQMATAYGYESYEAAITAMGYKAEDFIKEQSESAARRTLALRYIEEKENMKAESDAVDQWLEDYAKENNMEVSALKQNNSQDTINDAYLEQQVLDFLKKFVKTTEETETSQAATTASK